MSDGTTQASTILASLAWLTIQVYRGRGALIFCSTEDGTVGLFEDEKPQAVGVGDTAEEALCDAHAAYHREPSQETCDCARRVYCGDV